MSRVMSSIVECPQCGADVDHNEQPILDNVPEDYEEFFTSEPMHGPKRPLNGGWWARTHIGCTRCKKSTMIENARLLLKAGDDDAEDALNELAGALGIKVGP